jgi:hypothetical protein
MQRLYGVVNCKRVANVQHGEKTTEKVISNLNREHSHECNQFGVAAKLAVSITKEMSPAFLQHLLLPAPEVLVQYSIYVTSTAFLKYESLTTTLQTNSQSERAAGGREMPPMPLHASFAMPIQFFNMTMFDSGPHLLRVVRSYRAAMNGLMARWE